MDIERLKGHVPDNVLAACQKVKQLNSNVRLAHFLGQCAHESMDFNATSENLNYSADALCKVFPKYFDKVQARKYQRCPELIANHIYANRMGNGDEVSGDGWAYRGRGFIQLTGKNNYKAFSDWIGDDCATSPDLVSTHYPLESAAFFFDKNHLWEICDQGVNDNTIQKLSKRINGGLLGLYDRIAKTENYWKLLNV